MAQFSLAEKDAMLRAAFVRLAAPVETSPWLVSAAPYSQLRDECLGLLADPDFGMKLRSYVAGRAAVRRAFEMFFTFIAMAARAQWQDAPEHIRGVTARGWFLSRWVPTFLIIDGPVGRFILSEDSPLAGRFASGANPLLGSVRRFLNDRTFRLLRNGFAHWAFDWEVVGPDSYVVAYDWERDLPTAKLHLEEADAYHIAAFAVIEILNEAFISTPGNMTPNKLRILVAQSRDKIRG